MLIVFRIGTFIPVPNVNARCTEIARSIKCIRISEYIWRRSFSKTSPSLQWESCRILQHPSLCNYCRWMLYRKFTEWAKQGEVGRRKLTQFTRYVTIVLDLFKRLVCHMDLTICRWTINRKSRI